MGRFAYKVCCEFWFLLMLTNGYGDFIKCFGSRDSVVTKKGLLIVRFI